MPELSILVCSLPSRLKNFDVIEQLTEQARKFAHKEVEVLYFGDNKHWSVGYKRNVLLNLAGGRYTCFVDDDDKVYPHYVRAIMERIPEGNDCIPFNAYITTNGHSPKPVDYSIKWKHDEDLKNGYRRIPNHLIPIKSNISKGIRFGHINFGEDKTWAKCVRPFLKTESKIDDFLYTYQFNTQTTEAQKR